MRDGFDYPLIFAEQINQLHKRWDDKVVIEGKKADKEAGSEVVSACFKYALRVICNPFATVGHDGLYAGHKEFAGWYWLHPDLFLDTFQVIRGAWYHHPTDTFRAQIFLSLHNYIATCRGSLTPIEDATDGEISALMDQYWEKKISLSTVKKARQIMSKGKQPAKKSL